MSGRLIDADALKLSLLEEDFETHEYCFPCKKIFKAIDEAETVEQKIRKSGRLIDADAFEAHVKERYCKSCDDINGMRCKACWVDDMLGEIDLAPEVEVNAT